MDPDRRPDSVTLLGAGATVAGFAALGRILGFARNVLVAAFLGAGPVADALFAALRLPVLLHRLLAAGAFRAAFVPLFTARLTAAGRGGARRLAEEALAAAAVSLALATAVLQLAMPWAVHALAPGFARGADRFDLAVSLARIMSPYLLLLPLAALLGAVLNGLGRFAAAAAMPAVLNAILIAALLALAPLLRTPAHGLAWGAAAAGAVQLAWLAFACRRAGFPLTLRRPRLTPDVRRLARLAAPAVIGAGAVHVNLLVDTALASALSRGAVSWIHYADLVSRLPLGIVGGAAATALLPALSRRLAAGDEAGAAESMNRTLEGVLLLALPAALALMTAAGPVVSALFERGAFTAGDSANAAAALAAYAAGLPAWMLISVLGVWLFARGDTAAPLRAAAACIALNLVLSLLLREAAGHVGIALATAIASWINAGLLVRTLRRQGQFTPDGRLRDRVPRIAAASLGMAVVLAAAGLGLGDLAGGGEGPRAAALALLVACGLVSFAALAVVTGAARLQDLRDIASRGRGAGAAGSPRTRAGNGDDAGARW